MKRKLLLTRSFYLATLLITFSTLMAKPKVWIYTDMSDKTLPTNRSNGHVNDPDDISAMAGYLLMCNEFNTVGIVVSSTHRSDHKTSPNQGAWANSFFGAAYTKDLPGLQAHIGGYPENINFTQSCIKVSAEKFSNNKSYASINTYSTVKALHDSLEATTDTITILCWGSLTEPAILVKHCMTNNKTEILNRIRIIAHWTNSTRYQGTPSQPWKVANCNEDRNACDYLKDRAFNRDIDYYECGAIGQHGVMSNNVTGTNYFDQFKVSAIGTIFREGKFAYGKVDHSDAATYWTLLGNWGVSLSDINPNGTNPTDTEKANENKFKARSKDIHNELLRRAKLASTPVTSSPSIKYDVVKIFPNPASNSFQIKGLPQEKINISIFNITNKCILKESLTNPTVNITNITSGIYLVQLSNSNFNYSEKLIIER